MTITMTNDPMTNISHLNQEFKTWLQTLGFADSSVTSFPKYTAEMLTWFEQNNIKEINQITAEAIKIFFFQWKNRKNKNRGGGLSQHHISKGITAIHLFIKFLKVTEKKSISLKIEREKIETKIPQVLSQNEIKALYKASYHLNKRMNNEAFGQRDRAMLAVYYGCGLRNNEGVNLLLSDILRDKKMLHVRKGKGSKERLVPIANQGMKDIEEYLNYGRKWFLEQRQKPNLPSGMETLFIGIDGTPMKSFGLRLKRLKEEANIRKAFSLHTLRHSIATHLLQSGMDIEHIKKFLGHSSLESTQIYTHIINEWPLTK